MTIKLSRRTREQMDTVDKSKATNIIDMAKEIGEDPATFFEGEDWSGLDLRGCDLNGVSFRGADLSGVIVRPDQLAAIEATCPASMEGARVAELDV